MRDDAIFLDQEQIFTLSRAGAAIDQRALFQYFCLYFCFIFYPGALEAHLQEIFQTGVFAHDLSHIDFHRLYTGVYISGQGRRRLFEDADAGLLPPVDQR